MITSGKLKNNINYILENNENNLSTTIIVMFKVGSRNELPDYSGISHFIEHLMFKGTKKRPTSQKIVNEIYRYGGKINAFTDIDCTGYYITVPYENINLAIDILSDMLFNSVLTDKNIKNEKNIVINEVERAISEPNKQILGLNNKILYNNTLLSKSIGGDKDKIENYTREMILSYLNNYYTLDNMVISIVGKINKNIITLLNKNFGNKKFNNNIKNNLLNSNEITNYPNFRLLQTDLRFNNIIRKDLMQSYICISVPTYSINNNKKYVVNVIGTLLAGNMSSILFLKLREELSLVYNIKYSMDTFEDLGSLKIVFSTFNKKDIIKKCYKIIFNEFNNLKKNKINKKKLTIAKDYIIGRLKLSKDNTFSTAKLYATNKLFTNNLYTLDYYIKQYQKIKPENIYNISNEIFDINKINLSIISNEKFL